ncbi:hypothetical protein V1514DRAFT_330036 [Lipomyces japonicus]|uniref:uncharacterized protein n=1 Tax=Lipomyces japonicus TaxID=56871 RepID=UPI0034CF6216
MAHYSDLFPPAQMSSLSGHASDDAKSVLAMHALAAYLVTHRLQVGIWVDTTGGFKPELFKDIIKFYVRQSNNNNNNNNNDDDEQVAVNQVSDRVSYFRVFDEIGLLETVRDVQEIYSESSSPQPHSSSSIHEPSAGFIVLDSVGAVFSKAMSNDQSLGHSQMAGFELSLSHVVRKHNIRCLQITILVNASLTDHMRSRFDYLTLKPALGPTFAYYMDRIMIMSPTVKVENNITGIDYTIEIIADRFNGQEGKRFNFKNL